ncbi:MAG: hypothetical protein JNM78_06170 [Cyclobacteriaceae bacterium]|nr:hypothetical protein [Cyclobacteriaceae bacterium]
MWINKRVGHLQDWITQVWVKTTGRKFDPATHPWLTGPIGDTEIIKDKFIERLIQQEGLAVAHHEPRGLLNSFNELELSTEQLAQLHPKVIQFYELTSNYGFEIWSEWCGIFRPFGWLLAIIFSRRLQQLNLPLSALDSAQGINRYGRHTLDFKSWQTEKRYNF